MDTVRIDLNSDLGESLGTWRLGDDEAMLDIVTSANVACGFHAGDSLTLRRTCARAAERETVVVEDDRAGQDADDAEADREVAESAHRAEQLLRVAQLVQVSDVLLDDVVAGALLGHRYLPHSAVPSTPVAGTPFFDLD